MHSKFNSIYSYQKTVFNLILWFGVTKSVILGLEVLLEFCPILTEFSKIHFFFISKFLVIPLRMKIKIKNEFETENETVHIQIYSMTDAVIIIETVITQRIRKKFLKKLCRVRLVKDI